MPGRTGQGRVQDLHHLGGRPTIARAGVRRRRGRHSEAASRAATAASTSASFAAPQPILMWVSMMPFVQRIVARGDRAHQHVAAARRVLGQRVHGDVHAKAFAQIEGVEGDARPPGVVERRGHAACPRPHSRARADRETPSSPNLPPRARPAGCSGRWPPPARPGPSGRRGDAKCPSRQLVAGQILARSVGVVRQITTSSPARSSARSTSAIAASPLGTSKA